MFLRGQYSLNISLPLFTLLSVKIKTSQARLLFRIFCFLLLIGSPIFFYVDFFREDTRPLLESEKSLIESVFGQSVNVDEVYIQFGGSLSYLYPAFTVGTLITFPKGGYDPTVLKDQALLLHEMTHVWQYQHNGMGYLFSALYEEVFTDAYVVHFEDKKSFFDYDVEEQAEIVAGYYLGDLRFDSYIQELKST